MSRLCLEVAAAVSYKVFGLRVTLNPENKKVVEKTDLGAARNTAEAHRIGQDWGLKYLEESKDSPLSDEEWVLRYRNVGDDECYIIEEVGA